MLLFAFVSGVVSGQTGGCPRIKVGVRIAEVYPEVFDYLNKNYKTEKHRAAWLSELGGKLMESLRNNSPEIEFIYLSTATGDPDYDYLFTTRFALTGGGADIKVVPEDTVIIGDNFFITDPIYSSEYTDFYVGSSLIVNSNCFPNRRYILQIEDAQNRDIFQAIVINVSKFWRLVNIIESRENLRPVPPREPMVTTHLEKKYLSLLTEESRKMKIYENVKSCNGKPSYYLNYHSQPVRFPEKTDRGKITRSENCLVEYSNGEIQYILVNPSGDAVGEYTVKKGLDPKLEKITLSTCPLGNKPNIEKQVEFVIRGLKLSVKPDRKSIESGEKTTIQIYLYELDPDNNEYPCAGKEVEVTVTGVVDGTISHKSGMMTLDQKGIAKIDYKAGEQDKQIKISATFTPPKYPESAKGEATITIKPSEYDALLTITKTQHHEIMTSKSEKKPVSGCTAETREHHDLRDDVEATITITLKAEIITDMPVLTNQRWVSYKPLKAEITVFRMNYDETEYKYRNTSGGDCDTPSGYEGNLTRRRVIINKPAIGGVGPDFKVAFDIKTNKPLKFMPGMCAISYGFSQNESVDARKWPKNDPNLSYSRNDKIEKYLFLLNPVEDQIKDPFGQLNPSGIREYMKGKVSEEVLANIPDLPIDEESKNSARIHPDQLVKTGDGKTNFGGEGRKVTEKQLKGGTEREELTFKWNMKLIEK